MGLGRLLPLSIFVAVLIAGFAAVYPSLALKYKVLGLGRQRTPIQNIHGSDFQIIPNTAHAEDLHYHESSNTLYTAAEPDNVVRWKWYPPMGAHDDPSATRLGSIITIDPVTLATTHLKYENFEGPFVTHGIDIYSPPGDPNTVYLFAVNHLPNPEDPELPARSRVEIFKHTVGSDSIQHIRSVYHPLVRTPNDLVAVSEAEFYVTNDRYHYKGFLHILEVLEFPFVANITDVIHVSVSSLDAENDTDAVEATVAVQGIHNSNGLCFGPTREDLAIGRCTAGVLALAKRKAPGAPELDITEEIQLDSTIDNPSWFRDPYVKETGRDASGYVLGGSAVAIEFPNKGGVNSVLVWMVQKSSDDAGSDWQKKMVFLDDGHGLNTCSAAVLVAIDPKTNGGKKQARLFATGVLADNIVVSTIDL